MLDQLDEFVRRLERNSYGWRAGHLHLSRLRAQNRRDFHLLIAANEFAPLLRRQHGDLFQLASGDMLYFWKGETIAEVDEVVLRLRYLFSDDPLVGAVEQAPDGPDEGVGEKSPTAFCTWYDLEQEFSFFIEELERLMKQPAPQARGSGNGRAAATPSARPLDPATLARLEHSLASTDLTSLIRRQAICVQLPDQPPRPVVTETYVAIAEVARQLVPGVDLTSNPWLFQRLAETLDRRLLSVLAETEPDGPISINLRLPTLLSPTFLDFDAKFRRQGKTGTIVEMQLVDIFAELGGYMFIRDYLRERGYRICIDGLHHLHLPLISRRRLGADLVKLVWNPDLLEEKSPDRLDAMKKAIEKTGADRVILCRCDSAEAVAWGTSLGVRLFQGYYLDSRLRAQRAPAVGAARASLRARAS